MEPTFSLFLLQIVEHGHTWHWPRSGLLKLVYKIVNIWKAKPSKKVIIIIMTIFIQGAFIT